MEDRFNSYSKYIRSTFGERVQKISVDGGFTCPNRDGSKGRGGCTYCNNDTFNPTYTSAEKTVTKQIEEGIAFFEPKYKTQKYLAYFQAYTNTYDSIDRLDRLYTEALDHPKVIGLVISTRPDAINKDIVDLLSNLAKSHYVVVELGIESTNNQSLKNINRCHTFQDTQEAYKLLKGRGIHLGGHLIIGLQGEKTEDFINHAKLVSDLPIEFLKLHQLQIIKGTVMAKQFADNSELFDLFGVENYVNEVVTFLQHLRSNIILERFSSESPKHMLVAPKWGGLKNFEITDKIRKSLQDNSAFQGQFYKKN